MKDGIQYLQQSAICLALLYGIYGIFLRRDTLFLANRIYLLLSVAVSILIPFVRISSGNPGLLNTAVVYLNQVTVTPGKTGMLDIRSAGWMEACRIIYFTGVIILLTRLLIRIIRIGRLVKHSGIARREGLRLVFIDKKYPPFSCFNLIFLSPSDTDDKSLQAILDHERVHIRQGHTIDLLFTELLIILQWFNPFAWLTGRSVRAVHEFLADEGALRTGISMKDYRQLLLDHTIGFRFNSLANNFNVSLIKKRLAMMTKKRSAMLSGIKPLLAVPAILGLLIFFSSATFNRITAQDKKEVQAQQGTTAKPASQQPVDVQKNENPEAGDKVYERVETLPEFPGGEEAIINYIVTNVKYPEDAKKTGIQGTVFINFIVEKDGAISHVKVLKGIGKSCDEEALRVVKTMPKWKPGLEKGEPVRVKFVLPIKFALDKKEKTNEEPKK
jgi:TonB family protein